MATDILESLAGTHLLPVTAIALPTDPADTPIPSGATIVQVWRERAGKWGGVTGDFGNMVWIFRPVTNTASLVTISGLITSNATANGAYNGKSFTDPRGDIAPGASIAASDFGTLAATEDCLILNAAELGLSVPGHYLTAAVNTAQFAIYFVGRLVRVNSNGVKVVEVYMPWAGC